MTMQSPVVKQAWEVVEPLVEHEGLEIVDVEYQREHRGTVLRFYLDRDGGVSLDDLTPLSGRLGDVIDAHDVVPGPYTLELSSPGINRRLRRPEHFRRYVGKRVRVRSTVPLAGRRSFAGSLQAVEAGGIVVGSGESMQFIRFEDIAQANYEHDFVPGANLKPGNRGEAR
jgi:ribosome maturation factor RimP